MANDWSQFVQHIKIKAPVQRLYDMWTTRKGIESWFLRMSVFSRGGMALADDEPVQAGDMYHWRWHGYPDTVEEFGEILEANGRNRLKFVFGKAGIVTVTLEENGDETNMIIKQTDIPTDDDGKFNFHVGCSTGWTFYRCNLKSILHGGVDIRNIGNDEDNND